MKQLVKMLFVVTTVVMVTACGQKGALYHPAPESAPTQQQKPAG